MHKDFDREFRGDTIHPLLSKSSIRLALRTNFTKFPIPKFPGRRSSLADGDFRPFDLARLKTRFPYILLVPQVRFLNSSPAKPPGIRASNS